MWHKLPTRGECDKISLFTEFKTCTVSELFLFEHLLVYHSMDLHFIILEDRFVTFLGVEGGTKEEETTWEEVRY